MTTPIDYHLRPCPFCGYDINSEMSPFTEGDPDLTETQVICPNCVALGPWGQTKELAAQAWNSRTPEVENPPDLENEDPQECKHCGGRMEERAILVCRYCEADWRTEDESRHQL